MYTAITIGFLSTSYTVSEADGTVSIQVGVINGSLQREVEVVVNFSTGDLTANGIF